jgi:Flp pilus assembly protein TadD
VPHLLRTLTSPKRTTRWELSNGRVATSPPRAALALKPDYGEAWFTLGTALKQNGDLEGAESALRSAIRFDPENPGPYNILGQLLRQKGDAEGSRAAFAQGAANNRTKEAALGAMLQRKR